VRVASRSGRRRVGLGERRDLRDREAPATWRNRHRVLDSSGTCTIPADRPAALKQVKEVDRGRLDDYAARRPGSHFVAHGNIWRSRVRSRSRRSPPCPARKAIPASVNRRPPPA
jgi:hypothetical protein